MKDTSASLPAFAEPEAEPPLGRRHQDFLSLTIYVLAQQRRYDRASVLAEAMLVQAPQDKRALFIGAALDFLQGRTRRCRDRLNALDRIDPLETFGGPNASPTDRARSYLRARCATDLGLTEEAERAIARYMLLAPEPAPLRK